MYHKLLLIFSFIVLCQGVKAQTAFSSLELPTNARTAAMGGVNVSLGHGDVNMWMDNPALLSSEVHQKAAFNYYNFYAGTQYSSVTYAHQLGKTGVMGGGVQYLSYGSFEGYDATGESTGAFQAGSYAVQAGYAHQQGPFRLGATLKFAGSTIAEYDGYLLAADLGGVFVHPEKELTIGLLIRNAGFVLDDFSASSDSRVPFDVQAGVSFKPVFMPFRFTFTAYDLTDWKSKPLTEEEKENQTTVDQAGKVLRHLSVGTEVLLHQNFQLRAGYNFRRRNELKPEGFRSASGFAYGLLLNVKAFQFAYTHSVYHAAGGTHFITLGSNLGSFFKRKP